MKSTTFYPLFAIALTALFVLTAYVTPAQVTTGVQAALTPAATASPTPAAPASPTATPPALPDLPIPRYVQPA